MDPDVDKIDGVGVLQLFRHRRVGLAIADRDEVLRRQAAALQPFDDAARTQVLAGAPVLNVG